MSDYAPKQHLKKDRRSAAEKIFGAYIQVSVLAFTLFLLAPFLRG